MNYADKQANHGYGNAASGAIGGSALGNEPCARQLELPAACDRLERSVSYAEESLNELAKRLEGVLRSEPPQPTTGQQITPAPPSSGYASTVWGQSERAHRISERIQDLLRRLEA